MIDPADQETQTTTLDEQPAKKRRGRPATGKAMTPAEKQRAYRERKKRNVTDINSGEREQLHNRIAELLLQNDDLSRECNKLKKALKEEKAINGNVTQNADAVFVLQTKKGNRWADSEICYFSTMKRAENALKSLGEEGKNKEIWRIRQRQFL